MMPMYLKPTPHTVLANIDQGKPLKLVLNLGQLRSRT